MFGFRYSYRHIFARRLYVEFIAAIHGQERRDIEVLVARLWLVRAQYVTMPFAMRVMNFVDRRREHIHAIVTEPDAQRIENITKNARITQHAARAIGYNARI